MKLGIYGGTFDPIHLGHLITAEHARETLQLDTLYFVVAATPPHKSDREITPAEHRLQMVKLAVGSNPHFVASDLEIRRGGRSYTVDTLEVFHRAYGLTRDQLFFLMGADSLVDFGTWREPERILDLARVVVFARPDVDLSSAEDRFLRRVQILDTPLIEISATDIRKRLRQGRSIRYLVPESVARYIAEHGLYR